MKKAIGDIKYTVKNDLGVLSDNGKGYTKEVKILSWNGGEDKVDIRTWTPNGPGKGLSLTMEEAKKLAEYLDGIK